MERNVTPNQSFHRTCRGKPRQAGEFKRLAAIVITRVFLAVLVFLSASFVAHAESVVDVKEDTTTLSNSAAGRKVDVTLVSRRLRPSEVVGTVEPGQFPERFRVAQSLKIQVNGTDISVPHSAYADLIWVTRVGLKAAKPRSVLVVSGGDASESYTVRIEFDRQAVRLRRVYANEFSKTVPTEETRYFLRVLN